MIEAPGMYDLTDLEYHSDPCPTPSLSSSVAKVLLERSPKHARLEHPRLGGRPPRHSAKMSLGSAVHSAVLTKDWDKIVVIDAADFRTNKAKAERDNANAEGKFPILEKHSDTINGMVNAINESGLLNLDEIYGAGSFSEWTMVWTNNGMWYRCKPDRMYLTDDSLTINDLKTTELPATGDGWGRRQVWEYMMQAAFYRWGASKVYPNIHWDNIHFEFVAQEVAVPYEMQSFEFDHVGQNLGHRMVMEAVKKWETCMTSGEWPGYPRGKVIVETPVWIIQKMENDEC